MRADVLDERMARRLLAINIVVAEWIMRSRVKSTILRTQQSRQLSIQGA